MGSGLASAGGQTNPLVLSLSKDEPWVARGSTGSPRAWEPISARSKLDCYRTMRSPRSPRFLSYVSARKTSSRSSPDTAEPARAAAQQHEPIAHAGGVPDLMNRQE